MTPTPATADTAYVVSGFAGHALAPAAAGPAFGRWGWAGLCAVAAVRLLLGWTSTLRRH